MKQGVLSMRNLAAYWLWFFSPVLALGAFMLATGYPLRGKRKARTDTGC